MGIHQIFLGGTKAVVTGQDAYTSAGTYQWTCPDGVESISVVCVGAGGGGGGSGQNWARGGQGGGGGGLAYKNNISVTPGQQYAIEVGDGGNGNASTQGGTSGDSSTFNGSPYMRAGGGGGGNTGNAGGPSGSISNNTGGSLSLIHI